MQNRLRVGMIVPHWRPALITGTELFNEIVQDVLKNTFDMKIVTSDSFVVRYFRNIFSNKRISSSQNIIRLRHHPIKALFMYMLNPLFPYNYGPCINNSDINTTLKNNLFDIVYLSSLPHILNYQTIRLIREQKLPTKIIIRPNYHGQIYKSRNPHYQYILSQADAIHVWTKAEKNELLRDYIVDANKIKLMQPPIEKLFKEKKTVQKLISQKKIILYAGEKNNVKGIYHLISAVRQLKRNDIQIITIGPSDWKWRLYNIFHKITFLNDLGYVHSTRKEELFEECVLFCLPSIADSFGFAYLDAWKYRKPVVGARIPVMEELIERNNAGILVDQNNNKELANTIEELLNNPKLAQKLGNNGFNFLKTALSQEKNRNHFCHLFLE